MKLIANFEKIASEIAEKPDPTEQEAFAMFWPLLRAGFIALKIFTSAKTDLIIDRVIAWGNKLSTP